MCQFRDLNNEQKYSFGYIYSVTFLPYKYEFFVISIGSLLFFNGYPKWPPSSGMHNLALVEKLSATLSRVSPEIPLAKFSTVILLKAFTIWTVFLLVMVKLSMKTLWNWVHPSFWTIQIFRKHHIGILLKWNNWICEFFGIRIVNFHCIQQNVHILITQIFLRDWEKILKNNKVTAI